MEGSDQQRHLLWHPPAETTTTVTSDHKRPPPSTMRPPMTPAIEARLDAVMVLPDTPRGGGAADPGIVAACQTIQHKLSEIEHELKHTMSVLEHQFKEFRQSLERSAASDSDDADTAVAVTPEEVSASITERPTITTTPPPDPDNPYSDWDPRHAPRNSYFREAKRRAIQEEVASITLQRWLTRRVFIRNINRHLCRRSHTKQLCRGASSYAKELASTGRIKSPAPAPSNNNSTPPSPRMQRYPTAEETHAFRHRGLPLPTLPTKKKKRRKRYKRCIRPPPRNRKSSSTSSLTSRLTSLCHVKHPTEGCRLCPAFFHHQKDLEAHLFHVHGETRCLDKVTSTVETAPVSPVDAVLPRNPCSPTPSPAQPSSTTHCPNSSNTNGLGRQKDRVPSTDETPPVSAADANLPQNPYPLQHVSDLLSQLQSALQQLPAETYVAVDKSFLSPKILDKIVAIVTVMLDFFKDRAWGAASHPD